MSLPDWSIWLLINFTASSGVQRRRNREGQATENDVCSLQTPQSQFTEIGL